MDLDKIKRKLGSIPIYYYPNFKNNTIKLDWHGCIENPVFPLKLSESYKKICERHKLTYLNNKHTDYKQEEDAIVAYPKPTILGKFTFLDAYTKENDTVYEVYIRDSDNTKCGTLVLYNDEPINIDKSTVPSYYRSHTLSVEKYIGMWNNNVVYATYESVLMMTPEGKIFFIGNYPGDSESGKVNVTLLNNTLSVEEYVYYDCDHHHGGWETETYNLNEVIKPTA